MEKDKIFRELFKDMFAKPEHIDTQIMQKIYREAELQSAQAGNDKIWWRITFVAIGVLTAAVLIYSFSFMSFQKNSLVWVMFSAVTIPLLVDSLISNKSKRQRKENSLPV